MYNQKTPCPLVPSRLVEFPEKAPEQPNDRHENRPELPKRLHVEPPKVPVKPPESNGKRPGNVRLSLHQPTKRPETRSISPNEELPRLRKMVNGYM